MAEEGEEGGERLVLGVVEPGDSLPLPYGWRHGGTLCPSLPTGRSHRLLRRTACQELDTLPFLLSK